MRHNGSLVLLYGLAPPIQEGSENQTSTMKGLCIVKNWYYTASLVLQLHAQNEVQKKKSQQYKNYLRLVVVLTAAQNLCVHVVSYPSIS